jgi:hypothetical protein
MKQVENSILQWFRVLHTDFFYYILMDVLKLSCFLFQYFGQRFNRRLQLFASAMFSIQMVIYLALVLYAPALALHQGKLEGICVLIS